MTGLRALIPMAVLLLAGCTTAPQTHLLRQGPPRDLPTAVELEQIPFHPQERYQCGPAALATVLQARGRTADPGTLRGEIYVPGRRGSLQAEIRAAVRARGLVPYPLPPRLEALLAEVAAGEPVLVLQNLGLNILPRWHYAVVVGYDLDRSHILLRSGTRRRHVMSLSTFERTWQRGGGWGIVIRDPGSPPASAHPLSWLRAALELEETNHRREALRAYAAAVSRWPGETAAWFALGNAFHALERPTAAVAAYRQLIRRAPATAAAWNNLAHALQTSGCPQTARQAVGCALMLAPTDPVYRQTRAALQGTGEAMGPAPCPSLPTCPVPVTGEGDQAPYQSTAK
ncbi:PA2778 family cysteine peptidase [Ectothiorhodospira mobilis]|uniref:PA2778 family cysteine peptidase n=1 Tax=Ectothiorhodospira mobilis TaxID=195064 RepID=UPI001F5B5C34|nr:PA2778 family cysteine peptidase [Ectothiorhodospira mobilis]